MIRQYFRREIISVLFIIYLILFLGAAQNISNSPTIIINEITLTNNSDVSVSNNGSISSIISTNIVEEAPKKIEESDFLENEVPLMVKEFQDIMNLYNKAPSHLSSKVTLYRKLLVRLNKMKVNTSFLAGQRDLMKSTLRYRLGIRGTAERGIKDLIARSPLSIREDAVKVLVSFAYMNGEYNKISDLIQSHKAFLQEESIAYLSIIAKSSQQPLSPQESSYLLESIIIAPHLSYQHGGFKTRLLNNIQKELSIEELLYSVDFLLYNENLTMALSLMKVLVKKSTVDFNTLVSWGEKLRRYEKNLWESVKMYQRKSDAYKEFVTFYHNRQLAKGRGRYIHRNLYAYRGMANAPYNTARAGKLLDNYLKGKVEFEYIEKNAKRAFRNFLAYKKYDTLINYSQQMREKMCKERISPYINFWESYALLIQGDTNSAIPLLGDILTVAPESYYGIVAQKKLRYIFKSIPFSANRYFSSLKKKSVNGKKELLAYAHVLYYMGNRFARGYAEKIFLEQGLIFPDINTKISSSKMRLMDSYSLLGLIDNARHLAYREGIKNSYLQDVLLADSYQKINYEAGYRDLMAKKSSFLQQKNNYMIDKKAFKVYFPQPYQEQLVKTLKKSDRKMDSYLLYSVMRTESFYKEKALSHAGARGLMQIMPVTGKWLMGKYLPEVKQYSLYTPEINIYLGSVYLYDNIDDIGILPALAAYNSGPTFVRNMTKKYNPKTDLELVEIHPKRETRNYVQKVIESYERYSWIYNHKTEQLFKLVS